MSCICESSDLVYMNYINPVYVTSITSPADTQSSSSPSSESKVLRNCGHDVGDWSSQLSSARSCRRQTEFPYVVRRSGINRHRFATKSDVNCVIKAIGKLKFSRINDAANDLIEPCTGISQTRAADSGFLIGDCSKPMLVADLECSRSFRDREISVLNIDGCNSSANGERTLNVVKTLNDFHITD